ncbi:phytanoyl-CoA dioxygenase [Colletotrichum graminicola]|nr:phytanoyl-CoA dioxygenase [Colletotrichum graminicola]
MKPTPSTTALLRLRRRLPPLPNPPSPILFVGRRAMMASLTQHRSVTTTTTPAVIRLSDGEIRDQALSPRNLELAVRHLHADGLVVVQDVVPLADVDALNSRWSRTRCTSSPSGTRGPSTTTWATCSRTLPPWRSTFTSPSSPTPSRRSSVLGPRPKLTFLSANSAMPASPSRPPQRQPVHSDADFAHPSHPFALVVNVPLVTMTPANGSTEVWLGTHAALAARRAARRPEGQPRRSRPAPLARRPLLNAATDATLEVPVDWVSREEALRTYLGRGFGNSYDFDQEP